MPTSAPPIGTPRAGLVGQSVHHRHQWMVKIMIKQGSGCIQAAPLVGPHSCTFPRAVGAHVCPQTSVALKNARSLPHVLVDRLPRPVPRPVCAVLPDVHPASLGQHPGT